MANWLPAEIVDEKQQTLLEADTGHFSLVRAMHLADLITELNGMFNPFAHIQSFHRPLAPSPTRLPLPLSLSLSLSLPRLSQNSAK